MVIRQSLTNNDAGVFIPLLYEKEELVNCTPIFSKLHWKGEATDFQDSNVMVGSCGRTINENNAIQFSFFQFHAEIGAWIKETRTPDAGVGVVIELVSIQELDYDVGVTKTFSTGAGDEIEVCYARITILTYQPTALNRDFGNNTG